MSLAIARSFCLDIKRGAVAYYEFDEQSGNPADSVGSHTLTANGTPTSGVGFVGNARVLNGTNQTFTITSGSATDFDPGAGSFSGRIRANHSSVAASQGIMGKSLATGNQREWELLYSQGSAIYQLTCSSGGTSNVTLSYAGVVPATDTWFDFFFGYDRASSRMWMSIDAGPLQFATLNGGIFVGTANFCIGAQAGGTASRFAGSVDTAGYWNRTLRMHEIRRMHQARLYSFR